MRHGLIRDDRRTGNAVRRSGWIDLGDHSSDSQLQQATTQIGEEGITGMTAKATHNLCKIWEDRSIPRNRSETHLQVGIRPRPCQR